MPLAIGPAAASTPVPADLSPTEFARLYRLTPEEAVAYLAGRDLLTVTYDWRALWEAEHAAQFTVSRLTRLDLLTAIQEGITASVQGDLTRRDWMRDIEAMLTDAGWWGTVEVVDPSTGEVLETRFDSYRLRTIYETNVRQAHSAGRWQRILDAQDSHPYLRYVTRRDERVRAAHAGWDGVCLPVSDPWWASHYPLNGWRCRCRVIAVSEAERERRLAAGTIRTERPPAATTPWLNRWTGEEMEVPVGIDPGFSYNVGDAAARRQALADTQRAKRARAGAALAAADEAASTQEDQPT